MPATPDDARRQAFEEFQQATGFPHLWKTPLPRRLAVMCGHATCSKLTLMSLTPGQPHPADCPGCTRPFAEDAVMVETLYTGSYYVLVIQRLPGLLNAWLEVMQTQDPASEKLEQVVPLAHQGLHALAKSLKMHLGEKKEGLAERQQEFMTPQGESLLRQGAQLNICIHALVLEHWTDPELRATITARLTKEAADWGIQLPSNLSLLPLGSLAKDEPLMVMNHWLYCELRDALPRKKFLQHEGTPWPTMSLRHVQTRGIAQLRPAVLDDQPLMPPEELDVWTQIMWRQREELTDLDADALDALSALWLDQARSPQDDAVADVDDFLRLRGLTPKRDGHGRRGGYEPAQRTTMLRALSHIQNLWLDVPEFEVYASLHPERRRRKTTKRAIQSRAFVITDRMGQLRLDGFMDVEKFIFRPGKIFANFLFGPGRQTALLSAHALRYDPRTQTWEKRLARYLSWQWRIRARTANYTQPYRVRTLLDAVGKEMVVRRASPIRERLEKALDTLHRDQVIAAWQYDRWLEETATRRDWAHHWLQATVLIEPPDAIRERYAPLARPSGRGKLRASASGMLGEHIKRRRQALGLSQLQAAEQIGIHRGYLARVERGERTPSQTVRRRLEQWLAEEPGQVLPDA
jgi:hypothetical protein